MDHKLPTFTILHLVNFVSSGRVFHAKSNSGVEVFPILLGIPFIERAIVVFVRDYSYGENISLSKAITKCLNSDSPFLA